MALSKNDLARELFGKSRIEETSTHARETHVITGTATEDSADGTVRVDFGGNAVTADGQQSVPVTTTGDIREGDTVLATVVGSNGTAKSPTVIGTPGGGDRTRSEVAAATKSATEAETKAAEAVTKAAKAEKKADALEDTINSKADATVTLDDGSKAQLDTLVKQNAAKIETKADATVTLDDGTTAQLGTLVKQTAAGLTTKADATVTLDDGTKADLGTTVTQDHKSLTTVIKTQDDISTIIREDSTGVTVGKSEDGGKTYSTARAHVSSSGSFETVLPDGTVVASMGKDGQQIGADGETHFTIKNQEVTITTPEGKTPMHIIDTADYQKGGGTYITQNFTGDGVTKTFDIWTQPNGHTSDYVLTVDGITWTYDASGTGTGTSYRTYEYSSSYYLILASAPSTGTKIVFSYYSKTTGLISTNLGSDNDISTPGVVIGNHCRVSGYNSIATGTECTASGVCSHADGKGSTASGDYSHAEGRSSTASGYCSHAEGNNTASGDYSHAEGNGSTASGDYSHAEGDGIASGYCSHAEGGTASGLGSHAEGGTASGLGSHAEGHGIASGDYSHAEGNGSKASGDYSHAIGIGTIAKRNGQAVFGKYNYADIWNKYLFIVGNGSSDKSRSNAFAITDNGTIEATKGDMAIGTTLFQTTSNSTDIGFPDSHDYEFLVISAQTDDGVWYSQVIDTNDGDDFVVEFTDAHWNGDMYIKSATFRIKYHASEIVWENGGVIQVNGTYKQSGQYFYIRRVVGLGKK